MNTDTTITTTLNVRIKIMIAEGSIPFYLVVNWSISFIFNKYELLIADYLSSTGYSERECKT